jgi:hypothetical protein
VPAPDGRRHAGFGYGRRDGWERAQNVDSSIALGGGLWCRVHVMNGFEVIYQRERGPVGPLTQPLHDILTRRERRGGHRCPVRRVAELGSLDLTTSP